MDTPVEARKAGTPLPVVAAIAISVLGCIGSPISDVGWFDRSTVPALVATLVSLIVSLVIAFGLWRRNRVALVVALVLAAWALLSGLRTLGPGVNTLAVVLSAAVIVLLLVPPSSRAWFSRRGRL